MTKKVLQSIALRAYINYLCTRNNRATCTQIARSVSRSSDSISHDTLQQLLGTEVAWSQVLYRLFGKLLRGKRGWLILDDTVIDKRHSQEQPHLSWIWSSSDQCHVFGISCVLLLWTDGNTRLPIGIGFWTKEDPRSKLTLAKELLNEAAKLWKPRVDYVSFDSWYSAAGLIKHIRSLGWHWVTKLKCNRIINGRCRVDRFFSYYYGSARVRLNKGICAFVVKEGNAYFATSIHNKTVAQVKAMYRQRQWVEEVFKLLKSCLHLEACSARNEQAQTAHVYVCLMAFCQLERFRIKYNFATIYQLRDELLEHPIPRNLAWNLRINNLS